ncbi:MAG TPA: shikimate kinase AroL [Desulfonauticus sp.]|nr:MAG: Shikimate kinase 1 [Desulfonauticus sp. 38_4375]MDK2921777.1 shikimate kinase [Desulfonauticus sp.]HCO12350.1 shikimate kinase AroL [Desulfonauticus sp.]
MGAKIKAEENIYLIGPRGSGKTTVGKLLAQNLEFAFLDTDELIVEKEGKNITQLVEEKGWDYFRLLETEVLYLTGNLTSTVIATGGGIILKKENRAFLKQKKWVFYLEVSVKEVLKRLGHKEALTNRPPLTNLSLEKEIETVLQEREKFYLDCATEIIDGNKNLELIVNEILNKVRK